MDKLILIRKEKDIMILKLKLYMMYTKFHV